MKVLLSGFEPFGEHKTNSSQELVLALSDHNFPFHLQTLILPVSFERAFESLKREIDSLKPNVVICTGLAEKREKISLERIAINCLEARIPDNDGVKLVGRKVINDEPDGLFSTLPIKSMLGSLEVAGIPSKISDTAGTFVCNDLMYKAISYGNKNNFKAGFIHLPPLSKMPLEKLKEAFKIILREEVL